MGKKYIYEIANLTKKHGTREVLKEIWLSFYPGSKIGVLGRNGSGKSTLLQIMAGLDKDFDGAAQLCDGFTCGFLPQEPQLNPEKDVWGNVEEAVSERKGMLDRFNELSLKCGEDLGEDAMQKIYNEMGRLQDQIEVTNTWELDREIEIAMNVMNLPEKDASVAQLSGGEKRRVALCKLLLTKPDLLLLDEPTNHLDADSVSWLERTLGEYHGTIVAVTHDRYFLDNVAGWILELDRGEGFPFEGNYSAWLEQKQKRMAHDERTQKAKERALARELEWIKMSPKARQSKGKARITAYESLAAQSNKEKLDEFEMQIPAGKTFGRISHSGGGFK